MEYSLATLEAKYASGRRDLWDLAAYTLLIMLGGITFFLSSRAPDFIGDVYYFELAKSITEKTGYVFNFRPQTMVPPGFPAVLAILSMLVGSSYMVLIRSMAVFGTIGLIATYEVLRGRVGRSVAAAICVLLASSPEIFVFSTRFVFSDLPYLCTSTVLLWVLLYLDTPRIRVSTRVALMAFGAALLMVSVLMRSAGIALVTGMAAWIAVSLVWNRIEAGQRFWRLLPLIVIGLAVEVGWMQWAAAHQITEWPVHGYQENYVAQLKVKNGNEPEQGMATWKDVIARPVRNADDRAAALVGLLTRKRGAPAWYSPGTLIPLLLLLVGLGASMAGGGGLLEWYFISYEAMFLFWPWDFELRFLLPVVPLACMYMWKGALIAYGLVREKTRAASCSLLALAVAGAYSSMTWGWHTEHPSPALCAGIWGAVGFISLGLVVGGPDLARRLSLWLARPLSVRAMRVSPAVAGTAVLVVMLMVLGVAMEMKIGRKNIHFDITADENYQDIEAGEWIKGHSPPSAVVMARKEDMVFHYSGHKVIWFPPSTDPKLLMDGIRRYSIEYVVVGEDDDYWRPTTAVCFRALSEAYPGEFQLVHHGPRNRIFQVHEPLQSSQVRSQRLLAGAKAAR